nr:MAG TPA: hypothetical protein [Caudoviricetes sp.]
MVYNFTIVSTWIMVICHHHVGLVTGFHTFLRLTREIPLRVSLNVGNTHSS